MVSNNNQIISIQEHKIRNNKDKIEDMLLEEIISLNENSFKNIMEEMVNQINDKNSLKLALNACIDNELVKFAYKLACELDKKE